MADASYAPATLFKAGCASWPGELLPVMASHFREATGGV